VQRSNPRVVKKRVSKFPSKKPAHKGARHQISAPTFRIHSTASALTEPYWTRGEVGTRNLNGVLQSLINPSSASKAEIKSGSIVLRVGDRVIQQVNDYDREVFNGDLGTIAAIDLEEQEVTVQYQERLVTYDYADLNEITLAFATTIHKSQGSEYPVVILPLYMQHYMMLSRNLIYPSFVTLSKKKTNQILKRLVVCGFHA